uniref:Uncharacterized protein n=1 Tax=Ditylenchus dipsaci TaxID=166011 RepID=A0A915CXS9_9BILA
MVFLSIFLVALALFWHPNNQVDASCCGCCGCCQPCCSCAPCCNPPLVIKLPRTMPCCCCCKPCCCCCCGGGGGRKKRAVEFPRAIFPKPAASPLDGCDCGNCNGAGENLRKRRDTSNFPSTASLIGCTLASKGMLSTDKASYVNFPPKAMMDRVNPREEQKEARNGSGACEGKKLKKDSRERTATLDLTELSGEDSTSSGDLDRRRTECWPTDSAFN